MTAPPCSRYVAIKFTVVELLGESTEIKFCRHLVSKWGYTLGPVAPSLSWTVLRYKAQTENTMCWRCKSLDLTLEICSKTTRM